MRLKNTGGGPVLTDARGMGGLVAQEGFDYQLWDGLRRIPAWLVNPAFECIIFEGLEDFEARFFAPHAPVQYLLERYQAKRGDLGPSGVLDVLETFRKFDEHHPGQVRVHTLVTSHLPPSYQWLRRHADRVRRARPFYAPFVGITASSDAALLQQLTEKLGEQLGRFFFSACEVAEQNLPDYDSACRAFSVALDKAFPALEPAHRKTRQAFGNISGLAQTSRGAPISRSDLVNAIEEGLGERLPLPAAFPILVRSDRGESNEAALEIDASAFSGGEKAFPSPERWNDDLREPLRQTARWLRQRGYARISLNGSFRLSTAVSVGHAFRAANGFELEIPVREGRWLTDDHLDAKAVASSWRFCMPSGTFNGELAVSVGIIRDPLPNLSRTAGVAADAVLSAYLPHALQSGKEAQAGVALIKEHVARAVGQLQPTKIRLFVAGPAAFAVALGHRWNAMPPTQLHEFLQAEHRYVPTALIAV
jgi:hypothetical protein